MFKFLIKRIFILMIVMELIFSLNFIYADEYDESDNDADILSEIEVSNQLGMPQINSRKYIVYDRKNNMKVLGKNEDKETPMASTTKIMTAIVVLENKPNLDEISTVSKQAASIGGSKLGLKEGDKISIRDLLFGLLMRSGNDTAIQLAIETSGSKEKFLDEMNLKAKKMQLTHTNFTSPHGLDDPNHYTTAKELAIMTDYALKNETIRTIVGTHYATIKINNQERQIKNTNELLVNNIEGVYGVKTGFTNMAGRCLVTAVKRNGMDLIIVVIGADTKKDRGADTLKLIKFVESNYSNRNVEENIEEEFIKWKNINEKRIFVNKGSTNLKLKLKEIPIKNIITNQEIKIEINAITYIEAPIFENEKIGEVIVKNGEELIEKIDIVCEKSVKRKGIIEYSFMMLNELIH